MTKKTKPLNYAWRDGARMLGDPQTVGEVLASIDGKHGGLNPSVVVQHATAKRSPLHGYFEWDDSAAANKYREEQARHLIRSVRVVTDDPDVPSRPAFVHVQYGDSSRYQRPEVVVEDEDLWTAVIHETVVDLRGVEKRLEELIRMESKARRRTAGQIKDSISKATHQAEIALNEND